MPRKQTSPRVSTDASHLLTIAKHNGMFLYVRNDAEMQMVTIVTEQVKAVCGSALVQDEKKGHARKRKAKRK